jgi:hypothetical protein
VNGFIKTISQAIKDNDGQPRPALFCIRRFDRAVQFLLLRYLAGRRHAMTLSSDVQGVCLAWLGTLTDIEIGFMRRSSNGAFASSADGGIVTSNMRFSTFAARPRCTHSAGHLNTRAAVPCIIICTSAAGR